MGKLGGKGLYVTLLLCLIDLAAIPGRRPVLARYAEPAPTLPAPTAPPTLPTYLRFDRISAADGLSFSLSTSVLQDRRGFMWFGTRYGLNKYDGSNFTFYVLESRSDLLYSNYVLGLYQDRAGNLWVGTLSDLVRMDIQTGEMVHFKHDAGNPQSTSSGGLNRLDRSTGEVSGARVRVVWEGANATRAKGGAG